MITINSGKLVIPEDERFIGFAGDNLHSKKQFLVEKTTDENCIYRLYLQFDDSTVNYFVLDSKVENSSTILTWNILEEHIFKSGIVNAQIKSIAENGETYHTSWDYFFVAPSAEFSGEFKDNENAEFLRYEKELNEIYKKINNTDLNSFVSENRSIAGLPLSSDITKIDLYEALSVYPIDLKDHSPTPQEGVTGSFCIDTTSNDLYYCGKRTLSGYTWIKLNSSTDNQNELSQVEINKSGELVLTYGDGSTSNLGVVVGKNGKDGFDGKTPIKGVDYFTEEDKTDFKTYIADELAKRGQLKPEFANSISDCTDTTKLYVLPDGYIYSYMKTTTIIPAYTNKIPTSIDTSKAVYNGTGYKEGYRLNSSGTETLCDGAVCSGYIPITKGDIIRVLSDSSNPSHSAHYFDTYDSSFAKLSANGGANIGTWESFNGRYLWTIDTSTLSVTPAYFRCATFSSGSNFVVTVNEPIGGTPQEVETYNWSNTGRAFVPADYEGRIIGLEDDVTALKEKTDNVDDIPSYVFEEAEEVADKVLSLRNAHSFVFGAISDTHTDSTESSNSIIHAGMGLDAINKRTQLDALFNFGDIAIGYFTDTYKTGFPFVRKALYDTSRCVPYIQMQGNHDQLLTDTTQEAQQKYFAYIGANNVGTVTDWDNRFRNYGYRDFEDHKLRVLYLNTTDVCEAENDNDVWITSEQYNWLINTALNFSDKENQSKWCFIVCSHHPLNWYHLDNLLTILNAYKGKTSGSITQDGATISYDFTNAKAELIAHFHGHLHNFRVETMGTNGIVSITIPNACFGRNNEYGISSSYDEYVHSNFGDTDENGNQRQFNKTTNSAEDTSFSVVVVDRLNRTIHCVNYGAGIDREISY